MQRHAWGFTFMIASTVYLAAGACRQDAERTSTPATAVSPLPAVVDVPAPPPEPPPPPPPPAPPPGPPKNAEVEMHGAVEVPPAVKGKVYVYVSTGDCLAPDAPILGRVEIAESNGGFFIETFPPWASDLTVCAGLDQGAGKPTTWYGKAQGRFHAEERGEVYFGNMKLKLARGKPIVFNWKGRPAVGE